MCAGPGSLPGVPAGRGVATAAAGLMHTGQPARNHEPQAPAGRVWIMAGEPGSQRPAASIVAARPTGAARQPSKYR